jgi:hypothetical protein
LILLFQATTVCGVQRNLGLSVRKFRQFDMEILTDDVVFCSCLNQLVVVRQELSRRLGHKDVDAALNGVHCDRVMRSLDEKLTGQFEGQRSDLQSGVNIMAASPGDSLSMAALSFGEGESGTIELYSTNKPPGRLCPAPEIRQSYESGQFRENKEISRTNVRSMSLYTPPIFSAKCWRMAGNFPITNEKRVENVMMKKGLAYLR